MPKVHPTDHHGLILVGTLRKGDQTVNATCPVVHPNGKPCGWAVSGPARAAVAIQAEIDHHIATNNLGDVRTCRDCKSPFPKPVGRGRPPVRCPECRAEREKA